MESASRLTTAMVRGVFQEELGGLGGQITEVYEPEGLLYARGVLPKNDEVGPGDVVKSGVAVRMCASGLCVRPYIFRLVCKNGTIIARALGAWMLEQVEIRDPDEVVVELREAIRACASGEAFAHAADRMRALRDEPADLELMMMHFFVRHGVSPREISEILDRFIRADDPSRFGLQNAATALARDTINHRRRWELEELGGELAMLEPSPTDFDGTQRLSMLRRGERGRHEPAAALITSG